MVKISTMSVIRYIIIYVYTIAITYFHGDDGITPDGSRRRLQLCLFIFYRISRYFSTLFVICNRNVNMWFSGIKRAHTVRPYNNLCLSVRRGEPCSPVAFFIFIRCVEGAAPYIVATYGLLYGTAPRRPAKIRAAGAQIAKSDLRFLRKSTQQGTIHTKFASKQLAH